MVNLVVQGEVPAEEGGEAQQNGLQGWITFSL
jgi:hypothetical protein